MKPLSRKSFLKGLACLPFTVVLGGVGGKDYISETIAIADKIKISYVVQSGYILGESEYQTNTKEGPPWYRNE